MKRKKIANLIGLDIINQENRTVKVRKIPLDTPLVIPFENRVNKVDQNAKTILTNDVFNDYRPEVKNIDDSTNFEEGVIPNDLGLNSEELELSMQDKALLFIKKWWWVILIAIILIFSNRN